MYDKNTANPHNCEPKPTNVIITEFFYFSLPALQYDTTSQICFTLFSGNLQHNRSATVKHSTAV